MIFDDIPFIKPDIPFDRTYRKSNPAPQFRRKFRADAAGGAKLSVCGLGYAYFYLNGKPVSRDLFTAPVSNYDKTLWYNVYDVSDLICDGENVIAVWCGNGWYNEEFSTSWDFDKARWRDLPKFILRLDIDGKMAVCSDENWKCNADSAIWFNALRSGEYFDARKFKADWTETDFNDKDWGKVAVDHTPPLGRFRECKCEPVREFEAYPAQKSTRTGENTWLFDTGQNISGYIRLGVKGESGQMLTIRYAEEADEKGNLLLNRMNAHYHESEFQTDRLICSGEKMIWSPRFTYHGFRFIEIEGLKDTDDVEVSGIFVHQAVEKNTKFQCSDEFINQLFRAGQYSVYSNMFYMLTDCPTREKLGWTNDAQSSMEQILTNFRAEKLMEKWLYDIYDAMNEEGALPGIIPTAGWGYEWGNGPVSDGILFEIPYRCYFHTGDPEMLIRSLPCFRKYLAFLQRTADEDGYVRWGLWDWAKPGFLENGESREPDVPPEFINALLIRKFYHVTALAQELSGAQGQEYEECAEKLKRRVISDYIDGQGRCRVEKQSAVALLIYYGVYERLGPLKKQLKELIESADFHHDCGMVGLRRLYMALNKCGLEEYAYRILTARGYPGYREWFEQGATSLWEYWDWSWHEDSKNHHMYSDFMSWIIKTVLGIRPERKKDASVSVHVDPYFFQALDHAEGEYGAGQGTVRVAWRKEAGRVRLAIEVPDKVQVFHGGQKLKPGRHEFMEEEQKSG